MSYAILHVQKLKQPAIKGMQIHNQREKESRTNPDIEEDRSHLNYDLVNSKPVDYNEKINKMIEEGVTTGKAIRKDAVRVASFLITSDKEFFEGLSEREEKRFFESAYEFLCNEYGEKNMAYAMVHKDEKTPHMHVGFVPITEDGRLAAKDFFGGKQKMVQLQDKFHEHMEKEGFNLDRGLSSDRKHIESAKYKALTFKNKGIEAQEKFEKTMEQIQRIDDTKKSIESIEAKKVLGLVGMKEQDYQTLVDYATAGVAHQLEVENLKKDLEKTQKEVEQLKSDLKTGQEKIRYYYKGLQDENEDLKENLDVLAEKKAVEKTKKSEVVQKYGELLKEHKDFREKYNGLVGKYNELLDSKKDLSQQVKELRAENQTYERENLQLKEKLLQISKEFAAFKEKVVEILHSQVDRIKTFLRINDVDPKQIKFLDEKRDKFVQESLERVEKPQRENQREIEVEH